MLRQKDLEQLQTNLHSMKNLWLLMLAAPFIYLLLGYLVGPVWENRSWGGDWLLPIMRSILLVLALVNIAVSWLARRKTLAGAPWPVVRRIGRKLAETAGDELHPAACIYQAFLIFSLGLGESIALFGLALFILGDSLIYLFSFANFSAAVIIFFRPRMVDLISLAGRMAAGGLHLKRDSI